MIPADRKWFARIAVVGRRSSDALMAIDPKFPTLERRGSGRAARSEGRARGRGAGRPVMAVAEQPAVRDDVAWHGLTAEEACARLEVDPRSGLDAAEVEQRRAQVGPNKLAEAEKEPAGGRSCASTATSCSSSCSAPRSSASSRCRSSRPGIVIIGLTVLNAVLGLNQEGKAAESVAALQKMLLIRAHARRGGAARWTSPPRSSCPATSSPSRRATRSRPTGACSSPPRSRSRRRR